MPSVMACTPPESSAARDAALAELVEGYLARLQAGEAIDPSVFAAEHPEHAERLARLLPALELMDDLRRSSIHPGSGLSLTPVLMEAPGIAPGLLGDFQIVREVGRGGMGVVYEARQISLDRRVALKVLPMAAAMDPRQLLRFQLEAKAAACLHHTNIVPVHAVGCDRGVHYYAMQFIEGQTLAAIIGELRALERPDGAEPTRVEDSSPRLASRLAGGELAPAEPAPEEAGPARGTGFRPVSAPSPGERPASQSTPPAAAGQSATGALSSTPTHSRAFFRTVADLGVQAAEAIEHAHGLGVVHRDIKPANILIDDRGTLWITDFGLARLRNDSGLTMTGDLMGTLRYMSPEQAMGRPVDIDHRTDIYSLAVTLYELMTGKPAITGQDRQEVLRQIANEEPTPPRRLEPAIPRELETILLKAMDREPGSRYATAQELADDLDRFLEHKPIRARRPSVWEHVAKWARRHTTIVGAALAILTVTVLALLANSFLLGREQHRTAAALELAESRSRQARKAVDSMYTRVAEKWLVDQPGLRPLQREFLQEALAFYQEFARQQGEDPDARIEQAVALRRVGDIQDALSNQEETERIYLQAIKILDDSGARPVDNPRRREELAAVQLQLAWHYRIDGRNEEAGRLYTQALAIYQALAIQYRDRIDYQSGQARCLSGLGGAAQHTGRSSEAEDLFLRARQIYESVAMRPAAPGELTRGLAAVHHNLSILYAGGGRYPEAELSSRRAIGCAARALRASPTSPRLKHDYASNLEALAERLGVQGKWLEAEKSLREAIRIQEPLVAELPENSSFREDFALSLCQLGGALNHLGQPTEAEAVLRRSIGISKELVNETPKLIYRRVIIAEASLALAALERDKGHSDASRALLADARSHLAAGLAINPLDPQLNEANAKLEADDKGKDRQRPEAVNP
jgi:serine/threonine protein kinase/tetratricopeptide (TPR) repeat protein